MRYFLFLLCLLATPAWAQLSPDSTTTAPMSFYMSPTGNDGNSCVQTDKPCATLQGVSNKMPAVLRHNVTVYVAAGTYKSAAWTVNVRMMPASGTDTVTLAFSGPSSMSVYTPATGSATGTLTSVSQQAVPLSSLADTGQSWTAHDLRGRFIRFTSGSGATKLIVDNTATGIEYISPNSTAPSVGNTYSIETPAASIPGSGRLIVRGLGAGTTVSFTNLEFTGTMTVDSDIARPTFAGCRLVTTSGSGVISRGAALPTSGALPFYVSTSQANLTAFSVSGPTTTSSFGATLGMFAYSASGPAILLTTGVGLVSSANVVAESGSTSATSGMPIVMASSNGTGGGAAVGVISVRCASGSAATGFHLISGGFEAQNFEAKNCAVGVNAGGYQVSYGMGGGAYFYIRSASAFTNTATAFKVENSGRIRVPNAPTFSGVTTEVAFNATTSTYAAISGVLGDSYGSYFQK